MGQPIVSIIVPVYNVEAYLATCLDSLIGQTLEDIEIITIDDGSIDASGSILDEYAARDSRIRVLHCENAGVARTRNIGLDHATGTYILFVDSDDYIALRTCEVTVSAAERDHADIVVFGGKTFPTSYWADDSFSHHTKVVTGKSIDALLYEQGSYPLMCNKLYARDLIERHHVRFSEELILGEDNAFQFTVFPSATTISYIDDTLYFYRIRLNSAVQANEDAHVRKLKLHFDVVKHVWKEWIERGYAQGRVREMVSWSVPFLYNEAAYVGFNQRVEFAHEFKARIDELAASDPSVLDELEPWIAERLQFIENAIHADEEKPLVTIVVDSVSRDQGYGKGLKSIEFQTEQRVEILAIDRFESGAYHDEIHKLATVDKRVRIVEPRDGVQLIDLARGDYMFCAFPHIVYEYGTIERLLNATSLQEPPRKAGEDLASDRAQVVTCSDSAEYLRVREAYYAYMPEPETTIETRRFFTGASMLARLWDGNSLFTWNKLVSVDLLREVCAAFNQPERSCSLDLLDDVKLGLSFIINVALSQAQSIAVTMFPFLTLEPFEGLCPEDAQAFAHDFIVQGVALEAALEPDSDQDKCALSQGLARARVQGVMTLLSLVGDYESARAVVEACAPHMAQMAKLDLSTDVREQGMSCAAFAQSFAHEGFLWEYNRAELARLTNLNERNLLSAGDQAARAMGLQAQVDGFEQSISFRVGRAVTLVPRKAAAVLKGLRKRA